MYNTSSPSQDAAWRQAIDDELVTIDTTTESYASPQAAVRALIDWHCAVQIDPLVSSAAQALIDQGKREAQQAAQPVATVKDGLTVAQPVAEVGDLIIQVRERVMAAGARNRDPLYTAAPSPVALTDERMDEIRIEEGIAGSPMMLHILMKFGRAIERAHGIQAGKDGAA